MTVALQGSTRPKTCYNKDRGKTEFIFIKQGLGVCKEQTRQAFVYPPAVLLFFNQRKLKYIKDRN